MKMKNKNTKTLPQQHHIDELHEFIKKNDFEPICEELFECAGGHVWHIDDIEDLMIKENSADYKNGLNCE